MCNSHIKETEISQKRSKGIKNWKITYSVILSVLSNKTNLILGYSSPLYHSNCFRHTHASIGFLFWYMPYFVTFHEVAYSIYGNIYSGKIMYRWSNIHKPISTASKNESERLFINSTSQGNWLAQVSWSALQLSKYLATNIIIMVGSNDYDTVLYSLYTAYIKNEYSDND